MMTDMPDLSALTEALREANAKEQAARDAFDASVASLRDPKTTRKTIKAALDTAREGYLTALRALHLAAKAALPL